MEVSVLSVWKRRHDGDVDGQTRTAGCDDDDSMDKLMHIEMMTMITSNGLLTLVLLNNLNTLLTICF